MKKLVCFQLFFVCVLGASVYDFDHAMGMHPDGKNLLQTQEDLNTYTCFYNHYSQPKSHAGSMAKILHLIWLDDNKPEKIDRKNFHQWIAHHPKWKVIFWTNKKQFFFKRKKLTNQLVSEDFHPLSLRTNNWYEKENLLKFQILKEHGGIVISRNSSFARPLDELAEHYSFFCGLEPLQENVSGSNVNLSAQIIGSCSYHPIILRCLELIDSQWAYYSKSFPNQDEESMEYKIVYRTEQPFLQSCMEKISEGDIILPAAYFFEGLSIQPYFAKNHLPSSKVHVSDSFEKKTLIEVKKFQHRLQFFLYLNIGFVLLAMGLFIVNIKGLRRK